MNIDSILKSLASIFNVFKRDPALVGEIVEKRDIKNKRRAKKVEAKNLKTEKKIRRRKKRLEDK